MELSKHDSVTMIGYLSKNPALIHIVKTKAFVKRT